MNATTSAGGVSMRAAKRQLAVIWLVGAGLLFLILIGQTIGGVYGGGVQRAWGWLLPSIMPTLSLIVGVIVSDAQQTGKADPQVDPFLVSVARWFSGGYVALLLATILSQPFASTTPLESLQTSQLWLGPLQGLVSALMGALFVKQDKSGEDRKPDAPKPGDA
jgi:hypothetical protein